MGKKKWSTPKLTVLVRSRPEEAVLTVCKVQKPGVSGPATDSQNCGVGTVNCAACLSRGGGGS